MSDHLFSLETKDWEVRYGKERDGPLDALEVLSLLKMCKKEDTVIKNLKSKLEYSPLDFENFMLEEQTPRSRGDTPNHTNSPELAIGMTSLARKQIKRANKPSLKHHVVSGTDSDEISNDQRTKTGCLIVSNKYQNVLSTCSQTFESNKKIDNKYSKNLIESKNLTKKEMLLSTAKTTSHHTNSSRKGNADMRDGNQHDPSLKGLDSPLSTYNVNYGNYSSEVNPKPSNTLQNLNHMANTRNVYASNYIGNQRTQAYSWSTNKADLLNPNSISSGSNKFIEKVIGSDEIKKIRQMDADVDIRVNLIEKKEILLCDIDSKRNRRNQLLDVDSRSNDARFKRDALKDSGKMVTDPQVQFNRYKNIIQAKSNNLA